MGYTEMLLFCRGWTWEILWQTPMIDRTID